MVSDIAFTGTAFVLTCGGIVLALRYLVSRVDPGKASKLQSRYAIERMQVNRVNH